MLTNSPLSTNPIIDLALETALAAKLICAGVERSDDAPYHFAQWREDDISISAKQLPQSDGAYLHSVTVSNYRFRWNAMQFECGDIWTDILFEYQGALDSDFICYIAAAVE